MTTTHPVPSPQLPLTTLRLEALLAFFETLAQAPRLARLCGEAGATLGGEPHRRRSCDVALAALAEGLLLLADANPASGVPPVSRLRLRCLLEREVHGQDPLAEATRLVLSVAALPTLRPLVDELLPSGTQPCGEALLAALGLPLRLAPSPHTAEPCTVTPERAAAPHEHEAARPPSPAAKRLGHQL